MLIAAPITSGGTLTQTGGGLLTLSSSGNTLSNGITVSGGTLQGAAGDYLTNLITNGTFATPALSKTTLMTPACATWTGSGWGITPPYWLSGAGSPWLGTAVPSPGTQAGVIVNNGSFSQTITVSTLGYYPILFDTQAPATTYGADGLVVAVSGTAVATLTPHKSAARRYGQASRRMCFCRRALTR